MTRKQTQRARRRPGPGDEYAPEPDRERRPSVEELGGISEYQVRSASNVEDADPIEAVVQPASDEDDAPLVEPRIATAEPRLGPPVEEPLSVDADELAADYLRGAAQDPRPGEPDEELEDEAAELPEGEMRMLERRLGGVEHEGPLITNLPTRSEEEGELSELVHQAAREVRNPRRADRIREQSRRVANLRSERNGEALRRKGKRSGAPR